MVPSLQEDFFCSIQVFFIISSSFKLTAKHFVESLFNLSEFIACTEHELIEIWRKLLWILPHSSIWILLVAQLQVIHFTEYIGGVNT